MEKIVMTSYFEICHELINSSCDAKSFIQHSRLWISAYYVAQVVAQKTHAIKRFIPLPRASNKSKTDMVLLYYLHKKYRVLHPFQKSESNHRFFIVIVNYYPSLLFGSQGQFNNNSSVSGHARQIFLINTRDHAKLHGTKEKLLRYMVP